MAPVSSARYDPCLIGGHRRVRTPHCHRPHVCPFCSRSRGWDGHYRTAFRTFNSLSLSDESGNPNSEEGSWWADHKLRLAPAFRLSEHVSLYTEVDVLPLVPWGQQPVTINDPITGEEWPGVYAQSLQAPRSPDGADGTQNINIRRVFAELNTDFAKIRFGRMPVEWGSGMVYNAGNDPLSEYGDTSDRVQVTVPVGKVHLIGAFDTNAENTSTPRTTSRPSPVRSPSWASAQASELTTHSAGRPSTTTHSFGSSPVTSGPRHTWRRPPRVGDGLPTRRR